MPTAQERAKALAKEVMKAMREARAAEARVAVLSKEMAKAAAEAKAEAEAAAEPKTIVQYPPGRYECASCRHGVLFTEATEELPECDNCGARKYSGAEPTVTVIAPPAPKLYRPACINATVAVRASRWPSVPMSCRRASSVAIKA